MADSDDKNKIMGKLKDRKFQIEVLWCFLGGLGFVILVHLFGSGAPSNSFTLLSDIFNTYRWDDWMWVGDEKNFLFGFITTGIMIWSVKTYRKS